MTRPQDPAPLPWYVVLEENLYYRAGGWGIAGVALCESREHAQQMAREWAYTYRPPMYPLREQGRMVFRMSDDVWTAWLDGAMSRWHFRVSVAQREW